MELVGEGDAVCWVGLTVGLAVTGLLGEGDVDFSVGLAVGLAAAEPLGEGAGGCWVVGFVVGLAAGTSVRSAV